MAVNGKMYYEENDAALTDDIGKRAGVVRIKGLWHSWWNRITLQLYITRGKRIDVEIKNAF